MSKNQLKKSHSLVTSSLLPRLWGWGITGVESLMMSYTFFITSFSCIDPNKEITSSYGFFRSGSSNNDKSEMSTFREGGDTSFSTYEGGSKEATAFPFPFASVGTLPGGRMTRHPPQFLSILEIGREDDAPWLLQWKLEQP